MAAQKACKSCKSVFEGSKCPQCGSIEFADRFKGKVVVLKPEESEISKKLNIKSKGVYAIKIG